MNGYIDKTSIDIKELQKTHIIALLDAVIEMEEKAEKSEDRDVRKSGNWDLVIGWNESKKDTIQTLKEIKQLI